MINGHHGCCSTSNLTNNTLMANNHGCLDDIGQSPPLEPLVSAMVISRFGWVGETEHKLQNHDRINQEPALSKAPSLAQSINMNATKCQESINHTEAVHGDATAATTIIKQPGPVQRNFLRKMAVYDVI
jgi:hypothetical protein